MHEVVFVDFQERRVVSRSELIELPPSVLIDPDTAA